MAMKLVKKTAEYSIYKRGDERYAVKDAEKNSVNADEKVRILVAEGLITASLPAEPAAEEETAAETAEEASAPEEEAPVEEPAAEEPAAEEPAAEKASDAEPAAEEGAAEDDK
jgi:septal ring-binding cell division protein DamX